MGAPPHVMLVNNLYPPILAGGAERIVTYLAEGLVRRGHRVTVVSSCGPEMEPYPIEIRNGVEVIRFFPPNLYWSFSRSLEPGLRKWLWHARDAWNRQAGHRLRTLLQESRPDLLHSHLIDGFSASIWARAEQAGVPVLHTAHDYHLLCPRATMLSRSLKPCTEPRLACRLYRAWHMSTTRHVGLFASPSHFLLEMHRRAGLAAAGSVVVHNGIPLPIDADKVRDNRGPDSQSRFLMLTRLTEEKGINVVLDAVFRLPHDLPIEVSIAGIGPLEDKVRAAAAADSRIRYLGYIDGEAKSEALSRAAYLLLPSLWYENAPVSLVEAAAYGLGAIGSDIGAIPEFIEMNRTGVLFPPGDSGALAGIMEKLSREPVLLQALAARSRALARHFSVERMIDDYSHHYASLLGGGHLMAAQ